MAVLGFENDQSDYYILNEIEEAESGTRKKSTSGWLKV